MHASTELHRLLMLDDCAADLPLRRVLRHGESLALTTKEAQLLAYLADRPGQDIARDELLRQVWGFARPAETRSVDITVGRLRRKIEPDPSAPRHIITVTGHGYRFVPARAPAPPVAGPAATPRAVDAQVLVFGADPEAANAIVDALGREGFAARRTTALASAGPVDSAQALVLMMSGEGINEEADAWVQYMRSVDGCKLILPVVSQQPSAPSPSGGSPSDWSLPDLSRFGARCPGFLGWRGPQSAGVVAATVAALLRAPGEPRSLAPPAALEQPAPAPAGPVQPAGAAWSHDWYVARPQEEREIASLLRFSGAPVVISGPTSSGKTWLLRQTLAAAPEAGDVVVDLDLRELDPETLGDERRLLHWLALELEDATGASDGPGTNGFAPGNGHRRELDRWLERSVLPTVGGRLFLALDGADRLRRPGRSSEAFLMLRAWAGRDRAPWDRLRLLLTISTEAALLIDDPALSPFNLTPPVRVLDLDADQVGALAGRAGLAWTVEEINLLLRELGGQPMLVRLILQAAARGQAPRDLLNMDLDEGPLGDHLRSRLLALRTRPALAELVRGLLAAPDSRPDELLAERLVAAGLLGRASGRYRLRCAIYQRYLSGRL